MGLEALSVRSASAAQDAYQIGPHLQQRIIAFTLGHPGYGPRRISAELAREKWGGIQISDVDRAVRARGDTAVVPVRRRAYPRSVEAGL